MTVIGQAAADPSGERGVRYGFVDLLRGYALVVMMEAHVVDAYLHTASRQTWSFFWLSFLNGLVAPAFLFASGFSIMLQGKRQWENWLNLRPAFWKQMRRLGFILLVAQFLHLDHFKLSEYLHSTEPDIWKKSLQVDILHCIVVSLLVVHLLIFLLRTPSRVAWGAGALALTASFVTPWIWAQDFSKRLPLPLALYLNPHGISLFPLFPWICFLLAGTVACRLFLRAVAEGSDPRYMRRLAILGAALIAGGLLGRSVPFSLPGYQNYFTTSPLYVALRLGCVLIIVAALFAMERYRHWLPGLIRLAGQESLLVYGVHLWLIFSLLRGPKVGPILGLEAGYPGCFLLSGALAALMMVLARLWHDLKHKNPRLAKRGQITAILIFMAVFLFR